jgi:exoribonuclease R
MSSFKIEAAGLVADVIEQVKAANRQSVFGDSRQFEDVRSFVLAELLRWPTYEAAPNGVLVDVVGRGDEFGRDITLRIRPLRLEGKEQDA